MTTQTLQQTLSQTTMEHLGSEATAADLKAFRAALTAAWPTGEALEVDAAKALSDEVFAAGEWARQWTEAQGDAAAAWAAEMLDPTSTPEHAGEWTAFEVGEYHSAGLGAVGATSADGRSLDALFAAAGGERVLAAWLSAQAEVAS